MYFTGLKAIQTHEEWLSGLSLDMLNKYIGDKLGYGLRNIEAFEYYLYHEKCFKRDEGIEFYQQTIKDLDFKYSCSKFCEVVEKGIKVVGSYNPENFNEFDEEFSLSCWMNYGEINFRCYEKGMEELKKRSGI
jgi:hypothetical protein